MLLKGWLRFIGSGFDYSVRYNTRGTPSVCEFMTRFRGEYLCGVVNGFVAGDAAVRALEAGADTLLTPADADVAIRAVGVRPCDSHEVRLGERLDIKFANALEAELDSAERVQLQVFQPPEERAPKRRWLRRTRPGAGDLLALTDRRLLWITDREKGFRSRYGSIASYTPFDAATNVALTADHLQVDLPGGVAWHVPVKPAYGKAVEELAAAIANARTSSPYRSATGRT